MNDIIPTCLFSIKRRRQWKNSIRNICNAYRKIWKISYTKSLHTYCDKNIRKIHDFKRQIKTIYFLTGKVKKEGRLTWITSTTILCFYNLLNVCLIPLLVYIHLKLSLQVKTTFHWILHIIFVLIFLVYVFIFTLHFTELGLERWENPMITIDLQIDKFEQTLDISNYIKDYFLVWCVWPDSERKINEYDGTYIHNNDKLLNPRTNGMCVEW